ncbi:MAG: choice-of-anchor Q domain-containing protein [Gammaproteobacteria bacterium]
MTDPQRFSQIHSDLFWHSDLFGLFKAELARAGAVTGLADSVSALWPRFAACYQSVSRLPRKSRRALQRRWRRSRGGIALLYALGQVPAALAAQIDVGVSGCTLVDAITAANDDRQTNGCAAGSGPDTITLPAGGTRLLTAGPYYSGPTGLPVIRSSIVIDGNGSAIARDPQAPEFRILAVAIAGSLVLQDTTVTGGISRPSMSGSGGGIYNRGTTTLTNSTVSGNSAFYGYFGGGSGGGIASSGSLTLTNSTVSGNSAASGGGGVDGGGVVTLTNSTVSGNSAGRDGGGLRNYGTLTLINSTVSGNSAGDDGGGLRNSGTLTLTDSTVSGNSAYGSGGGVFTYGTLTLEQSLVSGNSASLQGPEVLNSADDGGTPGTIITNGFNLFGHDGVAGVDGFASGAPGATDVVPAVPLTAILDPALTDNGGPTSTQALVIGSPAIDAVPAASCATNGDQRGVTRPQDGDEDTLADCDIGSFELQPPPLPPPPSPPEATPAEPNPQLRCTGSACRVLIKCDAVQGSVEPCDTSVVIFVRARVLRLDDDSAAKVANRIRFAAGAANIPPGGTTNVRLRLTKRGRQIVRADRDRRLTGVMEIRNSIGPVQNVPVRIRIRR